MSPLPTCPRKGKGRGRLVDVGNSDSHSSGENTRQLGCCASHNARKHAARSFEHEALQHVADTHIRRRLRDDRECVRLGERG